MINSLLDYGNDFFIENILQYCDYNTLVNIVQTNKEINNLYNTNFLKIKEWYLSPYKEEYINGNKNVYLRIGHRKVHDKNKISTYLFNTSKCKIQEYFDNNVIQYDYMKNNNVYDGVYMENHPNGQCFRKLIYSNNMKNGLETFYSKEGVITSTTNWLNNRLHGTSIIYHDGIVQQVSNYRYGKLHGDLILYDNGIKVKHTQYMYGKKEGICQQWYSQNTKVNKISNYTNDLLNGLYVIYHINGNIFFNGIYRYGECIHKKFYDEDNKQIVFDTSWTIYEMKEILETIEISIKDKKKSDIIAFMNKE